MFKKEDILVSSWGYGQTNKNFYQVVEVLPKSVKVVYMEDVDVAEDPIHRTYSKVPTTPVKMKPITKKVHINEYNNEPYISLTSWKDAYKWDGKPEVYDNNY